MLSIILLVYFAFPRDLNKRQPQKYANVPKNKQDWSRPESRTVLWLGIAEKTFEAVVKFASTFTHKKYKNLEKFIKKMQTSYPFK